MYVGEVIDDKTNYLANLHVGAALSNPGNWDEYTQTFHGTFQEGYSLTLAEMIGHGVIPVSTDSGGAEPLQDAQLGKFVVPLSVIQTEGMDPFIALTAKRMRESAFTPLSRRNIASRARTVNNMGDDYTSYLIDLVNTN